VGRRLVVYSAAGDRRDADIIRQGELLGDGFDHVILYEDPNCNRGRKDGEIMALFRQGLARGRRVKTIEEVPGALKAIEVAFDEVRSTELLMVQVDLVDKTIDNVKRRLAQGAAREISFREAQVLIEGKPAVRSTVRASRVGALP
jgi:cyanophycin synthetase